MRFIVLATVICMASAGRLSRQVSLPADGASTVDLPGVLIEQLGAVTRQVGGIQSVLTDLNSQLNRLVQTGSRLVSGQVAESEPKADGPSVSPTDTILESLNRFTHQFASVQRVLGDISGQLNRLVETGSRLVSGQVAESEKAESSHPSPAESVLSSLAAVTGQFQGMQRILSDLSGQFNRFVSTGSRLVSGQTAESSGFGSPVDSIFSSLSSLTGQFQGMQRVLGDMTTQVNRMITSSTRLVTGLEAEVPSTEVLTSPTDQVLSSLNQVTTQFAAMQRVLGELSGQLNRLVQTSSRLVSGQVAESDKAGPASPTDNILTTLNQVTAHFSQMQRVLGELSGQVNRMIETGSRLVQG